MDGDGLDGFEEAFRRFLILYVWMYVGFETRELCGLEFLLIRFALFFILLFLFGLVFMCQMGIFFIDWGK